MPPIIRASQGKKSVISVKASLGAPSGGMRPDMPPSALGPLDFTNLENCRRVGGLVVSRGGQAEFAELAGEATGMVDFQTAGILAGKNGPDGAGGGGRTILIRSAYSFYSYSEFQEPKVQQVYSDFTSNDERTALVDVHIEPVGDVPGFSGMLVSQSFPPGDVSAEIRRLDFPTDPAGLSLIAQVNPPWSRAWSAPESGADPYVLCYGITPAGTKVVVAVNASVSVSGALYSWDGKTGYLEHSSATQRFGQLANFRDLVVAGATVLGGAAQPLFVRAADGTWSQVVPASGNIGNFFAHTTASYKDRFYIPGTGDVASMRSLFRFDGSAVVELLPATTGVTDGATTAIFNVKSFGGYLYYLWGTGPGGTLTEFYLGRFDGTTWDATYKNLLTDFPNAYLASPVTSKLGMCVARGSLYCLVQLGNSATDINLIKSDELDVASAWTAVYLDDASLQSDVVVATSWIMAI